jgi:molybdenum cofactor guanylyltransferase
MGCDKALLPFRGGKLAQSVACAVSAAAGSATLIGDPCRYGALGYPVIPDLYPGEGPLGGILTALRHSCAGHDLKDWSLPNHWSPPNHWSLITACDMPQLDGEMLRGLIRMAAGCDADALLPVSPEGRPEPLCALYHQRCLEVFEGVFTSGIRKITAALESVRTIRVPFAEVSYFQNVNTPEDWSGHAAG